MPFCNKCGCEIAENITFCPKCGGNQQGGQSPAQSTGDKPTLYGPIAACILSIFLPPLGVFLHESNWKTLKQESKAKTSLIWFICLLVFFPVGLLILIAWYITSARGQVIYIKERYGTDYKKKSLLIPIIIVVVYILLLGILIPKMNGTMPDAKAGELITARTWSSLQKAYIMEMGKVGDCSQIGYTIPESVTFTYKCGVQNGIAIWTAENKVDLGECKARNQWILNMERDMIIRMQVPDDVNCQIITPPEFGTFFSK